MVYIDFKVFCVILLVKDLGLILFCNEFNVEIFLVLVNIIYFLLKRLGWFLVIVVIMLVCMCEFWCILSEVKYNLNSVILLIKFFINFLKRDWCFLIKIVLIFERWFIIFLVEIVVLFGGRLIFLKSFVLSLINRFFVLLNVIFWWSFWIFLW